MKYSLKLICFILLSFVISSSDCNPLPVYLPPILTSPANEENTVVNPVVLKWNGSDKAKYNIWMSIGANNKTPNILVANNVSGNSFTYNIGFPGFWIYWKVVAKYTEKDSTTSSTNSFYLFDFIKNQSLTYKYLASYALVYNGETTILSYEPIETSTAPTQEEDTKYKKIWTYITSFIPLEIFSTYKVSKMILYYNQNTLGYVSQQPNLTWNYAFNYGYAYNNDQTMLDPSGGMTYTAIHELGHILSLNENQMNSNITQSSCNSYFDTNYGCSTTGSYIRSHYDQFWKSVYLDWQNDNTSSKTNFYTKYNDRFVTAYAATNIKEDFAETFAYFVLKPIQPPLNAPKEADRKIATMYLSPSLVEIRNKIRTNLSIIQKASGSLQYYSMNGEQLLAFMSKHTFSCGLK